MKREIIETKNVNFIGCWTIENKNLFENIINFFEKNINLQNSVAIESGVKRKTVDILIEPKNLKNEKYLIFNKYLNELHKCFLDYKSQWPFLEETLKSVDIPSFNVQKYNPGDHFSHIHCERNSRQMHRVFAWMTYLNNVESGEGATYFSHHDIKIKPEQGKTLIWPAEWTHAHAGEILKTQTKYIVTGWMCFPLT